MIGIRSSLKNWLLVALFANSHLLSAQTSATKPVVTVSVEPIALIVREICSEACDVATLVPKGVSEHSWQPGPKDIVRAKNAVAAIGVGLGFDDLWFDKIGYESSKMLWLGKSLDPMPWWSDDMSGHGHKDHAHHKKNKSDGHDHDHDKQKLDPHVWIDARRMSQAAITISTHLAKHIPASSAPLQNRAKLISDRLLKLQLEVESRRKSWRTRPVVMFHDVAGYFARRFSLPVLAISVGDGGHDLSAKMIADVSKRFKNSSVAAIMVEKEDGAAKSLARELKTSVKIVDFAAAKSYAAWDDWYLHVVTAWEDVLKS